MTGHFTLLNLYSSTVMVTFFCGVDGVRNGKKFNSSHTYTADIPPPPPPPHTHTHTTSYMHWVCFCFCGSRYKLNMRSAQLVS